MINAVPRNVVLHIGDCSTEGRVGMKRKLVLSLAVLLILMDSMCFMGNAATGSRSDGSIIADHTCARIDNIPDKWVKKAREELHIAYGHTSHGSQIVYGMMGLTYFKGGEFIYEKGAPKGSIDLRDNPFGGEMDLGNPDYKSWAEATKKYLTGNTDINVVMWSWCGQLSKMDKSQVKNYLELMQELEKQFPKVTFVYMTGHLDGSGLEGKLAENNKQIREFCTNNGKVLFDFADIESYNPDGENFADKYADDACRYDSDGDKKPDKNWAQDWQKSHKKNQDWYDCYSAHSEPVNANMKAYAMWWLLSRLAGWNGRGETGVDNDDYELYARRLESIGLFKGTDKGFDLDRTPSRIEGAIMLTRLLGGEKEALGKLYTHPFNDASRTWEKPYVGYLYQYGLSNGVTQDTFGSNTELDANTYTTFLLRVLGYSDKNSADFTWNSSVEKIKDMAMISEDYYSTLRKEQFNRGHLAKLTYLTLFEKMKGNDRTLLEHLLNKGAVEAKAAEKLQ